MALAISPAFIRMVSFGCSPEFVRVTALFLVNNVCALMTK